MINPSGKPGKNFADDRFGEIIIKLNKEKLKLSANAKTDNFFRNIIAPNVLTLGQNKEIMATDCGATDHSNCHSVVDIYHDVIFIFDQLAVGKVFEKHPGRGFGDNLERVDTDLWRKDMIAIASGFFYKTIYTAQKVIGIKTRN